MESPWGRLRATLAATAAVAAVTLASTGSASAQDEDVVVPPGDWPDDAYNWMVDFIDTNEQLLPEIYPASFDDGGQALEDMGYVDFGPAAPGGYDHWVNIDLYDDEHLLNPYHAESLVYRYDGGGTWVLEAAMYMHRPGVMAHDLPPLISWIPGWHGHPELCRDPDDGTFAGITDPEDPNCPSGTENAATPVMVHAWITDPGCGHRFGGVGTDGLHCDVSHGDH